MADVIDLETVSPTDLLILAMIAARFLELVRQGHRATQVLMNPKTLQTRPKSLFGNAVEVVYSSLIAQGTAHLMSSDRVVVTRYVPDQDYG